MALQDPWSLSMARSPMKETFVMLLKPLVSLRRCQANTPVHNWVSKDVKPNHRLFRARHMREDAARTLRWEPGSRLESL